MPRRTKLGPGAVVEDTIEDQDGDTRVTVEANTDDDAIRFNTAGQERMVIDEVGAITIQEHVTIGQYTLPTTDGSTNQVLTTDGAGNVTFQDQSATGGLFVQGHVELGILTAMPVNWFNVVSIGSGAAAQFKSWFIAPYAGTITGVILSIKAPSLTTTNDGNIRFQVFLNQSDFNSAAATASVGADDFTETVTGFEGGNNDLYTKTFSLSTGISVAPGDLIQIRADKTTGSVRDAVVTLLFS